MNNTSVNNNNKNKNFQWENDLEFALFSDSDPFQMLSLIKNIILIRILEKYKRYPKRKAEKLTYSTGLIICKYYQQYFVTFPYRRHQDRRK